MLIDSHVHLDLPVFAADRAAVLARSRAAGVTGWVVPAVATADWAALAALAGATPRLYFALGLHPWCIGGQDESALAELALWLARRPPGLVAVGECGLDGLIATDLARQETVLVAQIRLACEHRLPLILHSRKTHAALLGLLRRHRPSAGGVVHGFSGSLEEAMAFWRLGFHLGVGGVITHARAAKTRRALAAMPVEALLLETDAPSMPLAGEQGARNEPANLPKVLAALAQLRNCAAAPLADQLTANTVRLFHLC